MKYLKRFNENTEYNFEIFLNKFEQETFDYLAFLYDEGVTMNVEDNSGYVKMVNPNIGSGIIYVELFIPEIKWEDLKDYIIPYFEFINSEYSFVEGDDFGFVSIINISGNLQPPVNFVGNFSGNQSFDREKPIDIMNDNLHFKKGSVEENPITKITFYIKI